MPWVGFDPASQIVTLVLQQASTPDPVTGQCYPLPFARECLDHARTHGYYVGDGRNRRELKVGFRPSGVAFEEPSLYDVHVKGMTLPELTATGFIVSRPFNEFGSYYEYAVFFDPSDAHLAPKSPPPLGPGLGR